MTDRHEHAYNTFRTGYAKKPPKWKDLMPWIQEAILAAYLLGKLDGHTAPDDGLDRSGEDSPQDYDDENPDPPADHGAIIRKNP